MAEIRAVIRAAFLVVILGVILVVILGVILVLFTEFANDKSDEQAG